MLLETITGDLLNLEDPKIESINIHSIAWGLSRLSRFCGMTITVVPYSVAQHSIFVAKEVQAMLIEPDINKPLVLKALLHDAAL